MSNFEKLVALRETAGRDTKILSNIKEISADGQKSLHILWLYPDILNLHGGRGDMMALLHVANLLDLPVEIMRVDNLNEEIPFEWADMICLNSGELKCVPEIIKAMSKQRAELDKFVAKKGMLCAVASSGAVLAKELKTIDCKIINGLGLLDMTWKERVRMGRRYMVCCGR